MKNPEQWDNRPLEQTRDQIRSESDVSENSRNRDWWEALPMTYEDWGQSERTPVSLEQFNELDAVFLKINPYVAEALQTLDMDGKSVLEIGCGAGTASCFLAKKGAQITAVDITTKAVFLTRRHAELLGLPMSCFQQDAENLKDIATGSIDYVFSWGVLHHSASPQRCFEEVGRVLKPGGRGLFMVYHRQSLRYYLKGLYYLLAKGKLFQGETLSSVQRFYTDGFFHKHYTRQEFARSLQRAGLNAEKVELTHMATRLYTLRFLGLGKLLTRHAGWLLVANFVKSGDPA